VVLNPTLHKKGGKFYRCVTLHRRMLHVATLVLLAHVGPRPFPTAVARHLDDVSLNDKLSNLAWGTHADNAADAIRNGVILGRPRTEPTKKRRTT
jgi:hypothetical protein